MNHMKNIILSSKINHFLYLKKQKSHYTVVIHNTMSLAYSKTLMESGFFLILIIIITIFIVQFWFSQTFLFFM